MFKIRLISIQFPKISLPRNFLSYIPKSIMAHATNKIDKNHQYIKRESQKLTKYAHTKMKKKSIQDNKNRQKRNFHEKTTN